MLTWYSRLRLATKLLLPAVIGVALLLVAGALVIKLVGDQRKQLEAYTFADETEKQLSRIERLYSDCQANVYQAVSFAFAGLSTEKSSLVLRQSLAFRPDIDKTIALLSDKSTHPDLGTDMDSAASKSKVYFDYVNQVLDNIDDPASAASLMMATGRLHHGMDSILQNVAHRQANIKSASAQSTSRSLVMLRTWQVITTLLVALAMLGITFFNVRLIMRTVNRTQKEVRCIADGDLTQPLQTHSQDELGDLARSVDEMRVKFREVVGHMKQTSESLQATSGNIDELSKRLSSSAATVEDRTNAMSRSTSEVNSQAQALAHEASSVSSAAVAAANSLEQMKDSVKEISGNCAREASMAKQTETTADGVLQGMVALDQATKEIGGILKMIDDIARKTRLLALNATIEAASAGEAGKGFAVVASEVKELAAQSADAASRIQERIAAVQAQASGSTEAVKEIHKVIEQFAEISMVIAASVEEQSAMVQTIATSVGQVSRSSELLVNGVRQVADRSSKMQGSIEDVSSAASSTAQGAANSAQSAGGLTDIASELSRTISRFQV